MLLFALLLSSAAAMEIGLNMTGSGTAQSLPSSISTSTAKTITEIIIPASDLSSLTASPTASSGAVSPTITDGPIYTSVECNSDQGRNCERLPEQPYWSGITPGNLVYGFTPTGQQNPWAYYTSFLDFNLSSAAVSSAFSCSNVWYDSYTEWLATAPLTSGTVVPATTATSTLASFSVVKTPDTAVGTGTTTYTDTYVESGVTSLETETQTNAVFLSSYTTTQVQVATTETLIYTAYTPAFYPAYSWTASSPCCSACTIYGGNIEVMYWPATGLAGNKTTVVNTEGFTFTSPSIYMALQTLAASDLCGQVGSTISKATTLSFAQNELSTVPAYSSLGSTYTFYPYYTPTDYTAATFGTAPCTDETTVTAVEGITATVTYNPCYPYISIPPQIQTADPLWASCTSQWNFLLYDPPYVISAAGGLAGFSSTTFSAPSADPVTSPQPVSTTSSVASAGQTVPTVAPTTSAPSVPTTASSTPAGPASTASSDPVDPATSPSTSPVAVDPTQATSTAPVVNSDPPTGTTSTSPVVVDPANPSPSTSPVAVATTPAVVTIGSSTITANSASGFVVGTQTVTPGGQITVSGTTVSLASNGATIAVGSSTQVLAKPAVTPSPTYLIGSQTLSAGGAAITVSGTVYSLQSDGSSIVVGGTTQAVSALLGSSTPEYVVASGSQTLKAGGAAITVSGTVVSLQSGGSSVVIGGSTTVALSAFLGSTTTTASGLAGIIVTIGGFGTSTTGSGASTTGVSTYNGTTFTGDAVTREVGSVWIWGLTLGAGVVVVGWM